MAGASRVRGLALGCGGLLAWGCTPATTTEAVGRLMPADAEICVRRDAEGGTPTSPVYELRLRGDGRVVFRGIRAVRVMQPVEGEVDPAALQDVWLRLLDEPALAPTYRRPIGGGCPDHYATFDLTLSREGGAPWRAIEHASRCRNDDEARLAAVLDELHALTGADAWIGTRQEADRALMRALMDPGPSGAGEGAAAPR